MKSHFSACQNHIDLENGEVHVKEGWDSTHVNLNAWVTVAHTIGPFGRCQDQNHRSCISQIQGEHFINLRKKAK